MNIRESLESIKELARAGRHREAGIQIEVASRRRLNREERLELAYLANLSLHPRRAAVLLQRGVRPSGSDFIIGTDEERTEYAQALAALGASDEAIEILRGVDAGRLPRASRALAEACFLRWDWLTPEPALRALLATRRLSSTDRIWGALLFARCLIHGRARYVEAGAVLRDVVRSTGRQHFARAHWDALQLMAQIHFKERDWNGAIRWLEAADRFGFAKPGGLDWLATSKWRPLIDIHRSRHPDDRRAAMQELKRIKQELREAGGWGLEETRDCDFYVALALKDERVLARVYYGSRYPEIRRRLLAGFGANPNAIPARFELRVGCDRSRCDRVRDQPSSGVALRAVLEVLDGSNNICTRRLKPGQAMQRLLAALTSDFYVQPPLALAYSLVYLEEAFHPHTSYERIKRVLHELRSWLVSARIPLKIGLHRGRLTLESEREVSLVLRAPRVGGPRARATEKLCRDRWGQERFTAAAVTEALGSSRPTAVASLNEAVVAGLVEKTGRGPSTRYRCRE